MGMRLMQLMGGLLVLVHWVGCIWFFIVKNRGDWIPPFYLDYMNPGDDTTNEFRFYDMEIID